MNASPVNNPIAKFAIKATRSNAIKAKCAECMGCSATEMNPGFRTMVRECASRGCPLWAFRPYQASVQ